MHVLVLVTDFSIDDVVSEKRHYIVNPTSGTCQQPSISFLLLSFTNNQLSSLLVISPSFLFLLPSFSCHNRSVLLRFRDVHSSVWSQIARKHVFLIDVPWASIQSWEVSWDLAWRVVIGCFFPLAFLLFLHTRDVVEGIEAEEEPFVLRALGPAWRSAPHSNTCRPEQMNSTPATISSMC